MSDVRRQTSEKKINRGLSPNGDCPQKQHRLSHLDNQGKPKMVDVSEKKATFRQAKAACTMVMTKETLDLITTGQIAKGDVFSTAKIAGIMAAKKTADLIPLCHPLNITSISIEFEQCRAGSPSTSKDSVELVIRSQVKLKGMTGAEMEALTACSVAALTVYDMTKAVEKGIKITDLHLLEKEGGKSGRWTVDSVKGTVPERGLSPRGTIVSLNISEKKGQKKTPVDSFNLVKGKGVADDAHYASARQVSLLPHESVQKMQQEGFNVKAGSFAENITVEGINFKRVNIGTRLKLGQAIVEITDIGKDCHTPCAIYRQAGYCVMPEDGVFAKVIKSGTVKKRDSIEIATLNNRLGTS